LCPLPGLWIERDKQHSFVRSAAHDTRLGRSLQDFVGFLEHLRETKVHLFLHQQGLDTKRPAGNAMFKCSAFLLSSSARSSASAWWPAWREARAKGTKSGKPIGRPAIHPARRAAIRAAYKAGGVGLRAVAQQFGVGVETVRRCLG
jgi:DNA invertase Pin-like site-specific DNA recombinase